MVSPSLQRVVAWPIKPALSTFFLLLLWLCFPQSAQASTIVNSSIPTHTTWSKAGSPYQITRTDFAVEQGVTLTVEAGVEVIAAASGNILVRGHLVAQGSALEPILFTSVSKTPGAWAGISVEYANQQPGSATLDYVIVEYGGGTVLSNTGNIAVHRGLLTLHHGIIRHGGSNGISGFVEAPVTIADTSFVGNGAAAVQFYSLVRSDPRLSNLSASGNGKDAVVYASTEFDGQQTWEDMGLPYVVQAGLVVNPTGKLTIAPGVTVQVDTGFYVNGTLIAVGTLAAPITISGLKQEPGSWWGINVTSNTNALASARFDYTTIEYGGRALDGAGNLTIASATVTVTNSMIRYGGSHGIVDHGGTPGAGHSLRVDHTSILSNMGAALLGDDESANPGLSDLTINGNGTNAIVQRGGLRGVHVWENVGVPYVVENASGINSGGSLTIEPGVEVRFAQDAGFNAAGNLFAVGTPTQPITFTGTQAQPGWWQGIDNAHFQQSSMSVVDLGYCDIGYAGDANLERAQVEISSSTVFIQNCRIHDSASAAIHVRGNVQPLIAYNRIENNAVGLKHFQVGSNTVNVDARNNWWGDASGPTHASNPTGKGNPISDFVLFAPWLTSPVVAGEAQTLVVRLAGPGRFVPGSTEEYEVLYANLTNQPIENAVMRVALPNFGDYLDSTGSGIFWPQRQQLFWKLGTLARGARGVLSFRVRFNWGVALGSKSTAVAQLGGTNLSPAAFDIAAYLAFTPQTLLSATELSTAQVQAERDAYPELNQLLTTALGKGYRFAHATLRNYSGDVTLTRLVLVRLQPQFSAYFVWRQNATTVAMQVDGSSVTVEHNGLALQYDRQSGSWNEIVAVKAAGISYAECMRQCIAEKLPGELIEQVIKVVGVTKKAIGCVQAIAGNDEAVLECAKVLEKAIPGVDIGIELGLCNADCQQCNGDCDDPRCHCCKEDKTFCDSNDWLYGPFGIGVKKILRCSIATGRYLAAEVYDVCAICEKCVQMPGGPSCQPKNSATGLQISASTAWSALAAGDSDLTCDECRSAKDPNEKFGPKGDLLPGQLVTYTITYENEGTGDAFDVFIVDPLSEYFDLNTLNIAGNATFASANRTIYWLVGDLKPKGQLGSSGVVSFTVRLKPGLPSNTVVSNQAVVHFPSVPEETPTNKVINIVQPLVATPQQLTTTAGQPVAITLHGQDVSGTPLSYAIVEAPLYGQFSGTPPALIYTPQSNFSGLDRIAFTVSNGTSTSRTTDVTILVQPSAADKTPPTVLWTAPAHNQTLTLLDTTPIPGGGGPYYAPLIQVQFSEPLDAATITTDTIRITSADGHLIAARVQFDGALDQAYLVLREPLHTGASYTIVVAPAIKDASGNLLAAENRSTFQVGSVNRPLFLPFIWR